MAGLGKLKLRVIGKQFQPLWIRTLDFPKNLQLNLGLINNSQMQTPTTGFNSLMKKRQYPGPIVTVNGWDINLHFQECALAKVPVIAISQ